MLVPDILRTRISGTRVNCQVRNGHPSTRENELDIDEFTLILVSLGHEYKGELCKKVIDLSLNESE